MYTVVIFLLVVIVMLQMVQLFTSENSKNNSKKILELSDAIIQIADSKRIMEVIKLEGKQDFGFTLEDFKPKKDQILKVMIEILNDSKMREQYKRNASSFAYNIVNHSGFGEFVKYTSDVQKPLARVLANHDYKAAERLIKTMVNAL